MEKSYIYNQVTLSPVDELEKDTWFPQVLQPMIYTLNGESKKVVLMPVEENSQQVVVAKEQLERWLHKIEAAKKFQGEVETDIGWVVEAIHNLVKGVGDSPLKFAQQLMMGKLKTSELGLDVDRLQAIGAKYAPETVKKIQSSK